MSAKAVVFIGLALVLVAMRFSADAVFEQPPHFPKPAYNFSKNPTSIPTTYLGKVLFYDPQLSRNGTISCASCHSQFSAFTHVDHALSHGIDDRIGIRNAPALMNLAWHKLFMHDGAINHLDMQALAPISNPDEMDESIGNVVNKLRNDKRYASLFKKTFGDTSITGERVLKSIAQFMLSLVSANSKYDRVCLKKAVFTQQEQRGYALFKAFCAKCHSEPLFTNTEFANNGLPVDTSLNDLGRYGVTHRSADSLKFKVPTLRNIEFSQPYMHDGRFKTLSAVLNHYSSISHSTKNKPNDIDQPITLSGDQKVDLTAFLFTLSDTSFLFNPNFYYPKDFLLNAAKD